MCKDCLAAVAQLLSEEIKMSFWDYCNSADMVSSADINLAAEIEFIEVNGLEEGLATSSFEGVLFFTESPLLEIEQAVAQIDPVAAFYLARLLHWDFLQRIRAKYSSSGPVGTMPSSWHEARRLGILEPTSVEDGRDIGKFNAEEITIIAKLVVEKFPAEAQYIFAVRQCPKSAEFSGLRKVGWLSDPDACVYEAKDHIFQRRPRDEPLWTLDVKSEISRIIGESACGARMRVRFWKKP